MCSSPDPAKPVAPTPPPETPKPLVSPEAALNSTSGMRKANGKRSLRINPTASVADSNPSSGLGIPK